MKKPSHISLGVQGEQAAAEYYQHRGYKILETNWHYEKLEVDLIVSRDEWLVIVEVKTRSGSVYGNPEKAVNKKKGQNLIEAANAYCQLIDWQGELRFDILSILKTEKGFKFYKIEDAISPY